MVEVNVSFNSEDMSYTWEIVLKLPQQYPCILAHSSVGETYNNSDKAYDAGCDELKRIMTRLFEKVPA